MLGRTASSLYWMSRYVERAENIYHTSDVSSEINSVGLSAGPAEC